MSIAESDMVCVETRLPAGGRRGKVDIKALITDEVKPGILSRIVYFPEIMRNLITSDIPASAGSVNGVLARSSITLGTWNARSFCT